MNNIIIEHLQKISEDNFEVDVTGDVFRPCAKFLITNCLIKTIESSYRFVQLEFYKYSILHPDKFCHKNEAQLKTGKWYFHWSGIDITFGKRNLNNEKENVHGGILIRSIQNTATGEIIYGPLKTMRELMKNFGDVVSNNQMLRIEESNNLIKVEVTAHPRINLPINVSSESKEPFIDKEIFRKANYRFNTSSIK